MSLQTTSKLPARKPTRRLSAAWRKKCARSAVSNHRDVLPGTDGRSLIVRRFRDISLACISDAGGLDRLSEARLQLIRRFSACACMAEELEAKLARGEEISVERHALLVSSMVRITRQLGVNRIAKNITPSLDQYLEAAE